MTISNDRHPAWISPALLWSAVAILAFTVVSGIGRNARAASSGPAPGISGEVMVYATADESSGAIEAVRDGGGLSPMAEMIGAGGVKWFMVKTRSGNVGWIKTGDHAEARKVGDHFRAMPKDVMPIGPASSEPEVATTTSASGEITIPVNVSGSRVVVPVTLTHGNSSSTGNLLVDTGAQQTMISKRMASELRLLAIDNNLYAGIGGFVRADVAEVESIAVGEAGVNNMRVAILDRTYDAMNEGLLGLDFLGRFKMEVDTEKQVMVLTPRKE